MNAHSRAKTTPRSRELLIQRVEAEGWSRREAATAFGLSRRTVQKWVRRWRQEGLSGLETRSSRPSGCPSATPESVRRRIEELRRHRLTGSAIAELVRLPRSTVSRLLRRMGLGRLSALDPKPAVVRYEHSEPGSLLHVDTKKLGRFHRAGHRVTGNRTVDSHGAGWEFAHVSVDDHSRVAYVEMLPDERETTVFSFFERMLDWFADRGVLVRRVMTDNGSAYRSRSLRALLESRGIRHIFTRPYRPRTNGKAERFIQSALREWAYRRPYRTSYQRRKALLPWLHHYNFHRKHHSLAGLPPASRVNNLLSYDS